MRQYESVIIFDTEITDEQRNKKIKEIENIIEKEGKVVDFEDWGNKYLAYPIKHRKRGYYILIKFNTEKNLIPILNNMLKLSSEVLRHFTVRVDK